MNTRVLFDLSVGIALFASAGLFTSCDKPAENGKASAAAMPLVQVKATPLLKQDIETSSKWYGYLRGVEDAALRPQVTGTLQSKNYKDGSYVEKGDILFEIDKSLFTATLHQAEANLAQAEGALVQAQAAYEKNKLDVERYTKLVATGSVSEKQLTDSQQAMRETEAQVLMARAQIQQAKAQIESAQTNLEYATIKAPISGIAGISKPSVGDLLSPSMAEPLVTISSIDPIRVDFPLEEKLVLTSLEEHVKDKKASFPPFKVLLSNNSVFDHDGRVVALDRAVNKTTGTINVVGHIPNPDHVLRPGMAVTVSAVTNKVKDAYLVPPRAIFPVQKANFIVVVGPKNVPNMLPVELGVKVDIPVRDADGKMVMQPMQQVMGVQAPLPVMLENMGINPEKAEVIVEGTTLAAKAMAGQQPVRVEPYVFELSQPVVPSKATEAQQPTGDQSAAKEPAEASPADSGPEASVPAVGE